MIAKKTKNVLARLLWLGFGAGCATAQGGPWQGAMDTAIHAYSQGDFAEAEKSFEKTVKRAEAFGADDPRLATSLNGLAETLRVQGRYAEAEPHFKRALPMPENALEPKHPELATSLENHAALLRKAGRDDMAMKLETRAKTIHVKHAEPIPVN